MSVKAGLRCLFGIFIVALPICGSGCVVFVPWVEEDHIPDQEVRPLVVTPTSLELPVRKVPRSSGKQKLVASLVNQLKHFQPVKRVHAASKLGELGGVAQPAVPALIFCLEDKEKWVRRAASQALGKIGDLRAIAPLRERLRDRDKWVAYSASLALKRLYAQKSYSKSKTQVG